MSEPKILNFHVAMEHYKKILLDHLEEIFKPEFYWGPKVADPEFFRIPIHADPAMPSNEIKLVTSTEIVTIRNIGANVHEETE